MDSDRSKNKVRSELRKCWWLLIIAILICRDGPAYGAQQIGPSKLRNKLAVEVKNFDNHSKPLISTLLRVAAEYHLPMGIERVVKEAVEQPITVRLLRGKVVDLLDMCIRSSPGYSWSVRDGVVHVYGSEEVKRASNLFNLVIPSFEVRNETLDRANIGLRMQLVFAKEKKGALVGSFPGSSALEDKQLSFKARNATVRYILNRLVALHGGVVWVARVPPERLSENPRSGLWQLLPRSRQDTTNLFEFN